MILGIAWAAGILSCHLSKSKYYDWNANKDKCAHKFTPMNTNSAIAAMNDINEKIKQTHQQQQQQQQQPQQDKEPYEIRDPHGILELWRSRL